MSAACAIGSRESCPLIVRERALLGVCALVFAASAGVTIVWCTGMSAMEGMPMPGGWTMSMMWMRMPGQTWPGAAASFLAMWSVMMVAMMLPSLVPVLSSYLRALEEADEVSRAGLATLLGVGYFFVWALLGLVVFSLGVGVAAGEMKLAGLARAVPSAAGVIVLCAGAFQFTGWKAYQLACCREWAGRGIVSPANVGAAWRQGLRLGVQCTRSCAGLTAILIVIGVMDLRAMAIVTAAIIAERLAPDGERVARAIGIVAVATGVFLIVRAGGLG